MRKIDLAVVVAVVALGAAWMTRSAPAPLGSAGATPTPYRKGLLVTMAGVPMGCDEQELRGKLGAPGRIEAENERIRHFLYQDLRVTLVDGRVLSMGGSGRWSLERGGSPLPGFMRSREEVERVWGQPTRTDMGGSVVVYRIPQGEITYHFDGSGRVSQVWLSGALDAPG